MTRLTRVELRRIFSRKIVHLSVLAILGVSVLVFWGLWQTVMPLSAYEDQARQQFEQMHADWQSQQEFQDEESITQCLDEQEAERERMGDETIDFGCVWEEPTLESVMGGYEAPEMSDLYTMTLRDGATLVFILVLLGGSTATAAELAHRTLGTWLTFEPRRDQVFASKVLASGVAAIPITAVFLALLLVGVPLIYQIRGVEGSVTAAQWADLGWMGARIVVLAVFLGVVGAAGGLLLKHTGALLGIVVGYLLVAENLVRSLFPDWSRYLLSPNLMAWVNDGHELHNWVCEDGFAGDCREVVTRISLEHGALVVGLVGLLVILASWLVFRRRDVN